MQRPVFQAGTSNSPAVLMCPTARSVELFNYDSRVPVYGSINPTRQPRCDSDHRLTPPSHNPHPLPPGRPSLMRAGGRHGWRVPPTALPCCLILHQVASRNALSVMLTGYPSRAYVVWLGRRSPASLWLQTSKRFGATDGEEQLTSTPPCPRRGCTSMQRSNHGTSSACTLLHKLFVPCRSDRRCLAVAAQGLLLAAGDTLQVLFAQRQTRHETNRRPFFSSPTCTNPRTRTRRCSQSCDQTPGITRA